MKKHIVEMDEARAMMETLTVKIRNEIQAAEYVIFRDQIHSTKILSSNRLELSDVSYHHNLVATGEQEVVRVLQESLHRQSSTNSSNKHLYQERSDYLSDTKVKSKK
jgi:hypothetical protein